MVVPENAVEQNEELFPDSPRVIFGKAPLTQVVAQVLFPTILRIEQPPADFQERIRNDFPIYSNAFDISAQLGLPAGMPLRLPTDLLQLFSGQIGAKVHRFSTAAGNITVTLTPESLAIAANQYSRWEEFLRLFCGPLGALIQLYVPPFFTRIGLRYINVIDREQIGLPPDTAWSRLIRKEVLGELALPSVERSLSSASNQTRLMLDQNRGEVLFQHGLSVKLQQNSPPVKVYTLDFDFSRQGQVGINDAESSLAYYHTLAGRAFRWCLSPELYKQLEPAPPGD